MFYDSKTQLMQFADQQKKLKKSDLRNLHTRWKMLKKYWKVGIELSISNNTKSSQIYTLVQIFSMSEKKF